jgi:hypothetical protein
MDAMSIQVLMPMLSKLEDKTLGDAVMISEEPALDALDPDDPDLAPALKQRVRGNKTIAMLRRTHIIKKLCLSIFIARPLANYMDFVSLLETRRDRLHLKLSGIKLEDSHADTTPDDIATTNADILTGRAGMQVIYEYTDLLAEPPDSEAWSCKSLLNRCLVLFRSCFVCCIQPATCNVINS